jgi:hypothetical protein
MSQFCKILIIFNIKPKSTKLMTSLKNAHRLWLLLTFFLLAQPFIATSATPPNSEKWYLMASNGNKKKYYGISKYVAVFVNAKPIKGKILAIDQNSITLRTQSKENKTVAIADIDAIQQYNRSVRIGWLPILSLLVLLTIGGLLTSGLAAGLFLAMPVVSLFTVIPFWLISLIAEPLSKKSSKKGWKFSGIQKKR